MKTLIEKTSDKLVKAFLKNKIISPIPSKFTKKINQGDIIGTVGSTGRSTGPHLDFRVNWFQTRLDPMSVIN